MKTLRAITCGLFLGAVCVQGAQAQLTTPTRPAGPICNEGTGTPPLVLSWKELPSTGSSVKLKPPVLHLSVSNNTTASVRVRIRVAGALDTVRKTLDLGDVSVNPKSTSTVAVDLSSLQQDLSVLRFSGRLVAKGFVRSQSGSQVSRLVYSPSAYVHPEGSGLMAYRSSVFFERYHAGDFAGRAEPLRRWAADRGIRLGGISRLGAGRTLSDDDGGPREETIP